MYSWVGLDALPSDPVPGAQNELFQIGIGQQIDENGNIPAPWGWYMWFINGVLVVANDVSITFEVGQQVCCMAEYILDAQYKAVGASLYIINIATGQYSNLAFPQYDNAKMPGRSAEWIIENPGGGYPNFSLAGFEQVDFTNASASGINTEPVDHHPVSGCPSDGALWQIIDTNGVAQTTCFTNPAGVSPELVVSSTQPPPRPPKR
jgi:hypothetical protein